MGLEVAYMNQFEKYKKNVGILIEVINEDDVNMIKNQASLMDVEKQWKEDRPLYNSLVEKAEEQKFAAAVAVAVAAKEVGRGDAGGPEPGSHKCNTV